MNTTIKKTQWYEVVRPDGKKQYATKHEGLFFLNGSGRGYESLEAKSIKKISKVPKLMTEGFTFIGEPKPRFKALINDNYRWNGWAAPYVHTSEVKRLCKYLSVDGHVFTLLGKGGTIKVEMDKGTEYEHEDVIQPEIINDELYYDFGSIGYCFEFEKAK